MQTCGSATQQRLAVTWLSLALACSGEHLGPGEVTQAVVPPAAVAAKDARTAETTRALGETRDTQILFGDLHVHTTFSPDGLVYSLPLMNGEGVRPPADACDFARFCSALDFWSINDHAEGLTPRRWRETIDSIRQCNAVSGDPANPDLVSFLGWEWSQVSLRPDKHYGHKNVVLLDTEDGKIPRRPIAAPRDQLGKAPMGPAVRMLLSLRDREKGQIYLDYGTYFDEIADTAICAKGVDTRKLPDDCLETADDPSELFEKLDQWDFPAIVIPHGNAWGLNTPPGATFDKQLLGDQHDPQRQRLIESYSGHGNSEEWRPWSSVEYDEQDRAICPAPKDGFTPCCLRAGELIRQRCEAAGDPDCETREIEARQNYVDAGVAGFNTVPGASVEDWLGCGLCPDCFAAAFDYRPGTSTQYALAIGGFDTSGEPKRLRFGLIASSDNHRARAGTGYKEFARTRMTDVSGPRGRGFESRAFRDERDPAARSVRYEDAEKELSLVQLRHTERNASFFLTGGLVAAHSRGRDRGAIFDALQRRQVYGTSGDRILLWFNLLGPRGELIPMGSERDWSRIPRFRVRAAGAFEQQPGCPDFAGQALGAERLAELCLGECYHPSDTRRRISRIEVVRIHPQQSPDEDVAKLILDPWRTLPCPAAGDGCSVEFEDTEFISANRETVYYVRAIQEPTPAVNADGLRCEYDEQGKCVKVNPCYADSRTPDGDDCLAENEERAWSSPIFLTPVPAPPPPP